MGLLSQTQNAYYNSSNSANYGDYQFTTLENIINAFMFVYVGENKIISKISRTDVQFHAMRAVQELSYDILKSFKSQELEVPNTLSMILPQDYVNYVKLVRIGTDGIERPLYPASKTSDPFAITQNTDGTYDFGQQKRQITVTINSTTGLSGDNLLLGFNTGLNTQAFVRFRIVPNENFVYDYDAADVMLDVTYTDGDELGAATSLANAINNFDHHTVTQSGTTLVITYDEDPIDASSVASSEGVFSADQTSAAGSNISLTVNNAGTAAGDNIVEQVPSNTSQNFENQTPVNYQLYDINYTTDVEISPQGRRYGLDPQYAQMNGSFFIDQLRGLIKFSSALAGQTITLHYVSDGLGTDSEMVVHKFCEEACYKWIAYGILSTRSNIPPFIVQRFKKEKFAETRKAKIRLSNIKIEEFTQILKGIGKQIK
jgi:hypothetical protein